MEYVAFNINKVKVILMNKNCKMKLSHVSVLKIKKILKSLSSSRSTGIDELDDFSVKLAAEYIAQPVHHIVSLSFMQNRFSANWKFSKVLPLHKKLDPLDRKNYRPVAILSPLSKVLEKIVYEQIYNYFSSNQLLKKLGKRLTGLQNLRNIIPYHLRKRITEGMFTSILVYCLPVFGGCDKCEMEALQIMQNKAARLVTHAQLRTSRTEIFSQVGWCSTTLL